ncbi:MAG: right-handed parallel beta-helix repeat-containing protein [Planctomycetota bacterium]
MHRIASSIAVALVLIGASAQSAHAATIVVGKGEIETIQDALDIAEDFDTIVIPKGNYDVETLDLSGFEGLTIKGKGKPTLNGTGGDIFNIVGCLNVTISGLTFTGGGNTLYVEGSQNTAILKCVFREVGDNACYSDTNDGVIFEKCTVEMTSSEGFYDVNSQRVEVVKNTFHEVNHTAITVGDFSQTSANSLVEKNKVNGSDNDGMNLVIYDSEVVKNSIRMDGGCTGLRTAGSNNLVEKNKVSGAGCFGLEADANLSRFIKNAITDCGSGGMYVYGGQSEFTGNKIQNNGGGGVWFDGNGGHEITGNKVIGNGGSGVLVFTDGNTLASNKVLKNMFDGFFLDNGTVDNTLTGNTAKKNNTANAEATADINNQSGPTNNDVDDSNRYGSLIEPDRDG